MGNMIIDAETAMDAVMDAYTEYAESMNAYNKTGSDAIKVCQGITMRISTEQGKDEERIKVLEKSISKDNPRVQLQKVNKQLEEADTIKKESVADFWIRQYNPGFSRAMHVKDRNELERKKKKLEEEAVLYPAEPGEIELFQLRKKEYITTDEEKAKLEVAGEKFEEAYSAMCKKRNAVHTALQQLHEKVKQFDDEIGTVKTGQTQKDFTDTMDFIRKMMNNRMTLKY